MKQEKNKSEEQLVLGIVFLMLAFTLSVLVKPWYLGLPFFTVGLVFFVQGLGQSQSSLNDDKGENHDI